MTWCKMGHNTDYRGYGKKTHDITIISFYIYNIVHFIYVYKIITILLYVTGGPISARLKSHSFFFPVLFFHSSLSYIFHGDILPSVSPTVVCLKLNPPGKRQQVLISTYHTPRATHV